MQFRLARPGWEPEALASGRHRARWSDFSPTVCELCGLASGELLSDAKGSFVFRALRVEVLATALLSRIPQPIEKLLPVGRRASRTDQWSDAARSCGFFRSPRTRYRVVLHRPCHRGCWRPYSDDPPIERRSGRTPGWVSVGSGISEAFARTQVESGPKDEQRPDQCPVFIEEVRLFALGQALFGRNAHLPTAPRLGFRNDARMVLLEHLAGIAKVSWISGGRGHFPMAEAAHGWRQEFRTLSAGRTW